MASMKKTASKISSFDSIPLFAMSATDKNRLDVFIKDKELRSGMVAEWDRVQKDLLTLPPVYKHIPVTNSSHYN